MWPGISRFFKGLIMGEEDSNSNDEIMNDVQEDEVEEAEMEGSEGAAGNASSPKPGGLPFIPSPEMILTRSEETEEIQEEAEKTEEVKVKSGPTSPHSSPHLSPFPPLEHRDPATPVKSDVRDEEEKDANDNETKPCVPGKMEQDDESEEKFLGSTGKDEKFQPKVAELAEEGDSKDADNKTIKMGSEDESKLTPLSPPICTNSFNRESSPEKKIIMLNPVAISNMLKIPKSDGSSSSAGSSPQKPGSNTSSTEGQSPVQRQEFLKLTQNLVSALKKKVFCANTNCNQKTDTVVDAPPHARLYFGMKMRKGSKSNPPQICLSCFKKAEVFNEASRAVLARKENLFDLKFQIQTSEDLVDLDSPPGSPSSGKMDVEDSSPEDSTDVKNLNAEETLYSISMSKFAKTVSETMEKFEMDLQIEKCKTKVNDEVNDLAIQLEALDLQMEELRDTIDSTTKLFNDNIAEKNPFVEVGQVEIDEEGSITVQKAENLSQVDGLSRAAAKVLAKAVQELMSLEPAEEIKIEEITHPRTSGRPPFLPLPAPPPGGNNSLINRRMGKLIFAKPKEGQDVYAMHKHALFYWLPAKIIKITQNKLYLDQLTLYRVQFQQKVKGRHKNQDDPECYMKELEGRQVAFKKPSTIVLMVGTRIIARFKDLLNTDAEVDGMLYAGVVAEVPKELNRHRYLIFFDDGYAQYVHPSEVFPVVESSKDVWLDVHRNSQEFIQEYVTKFPDRHMIRAEIGATFSVELNGTWHQARIVDTDGSLMKVQYLRNRNPLDSLPNIEFEWIYRGSTRLGPLFSKLKSLQSKPTLSVARRHTYSSRKTHNFSFEVNRNCEEPLGGQEVARKHTGFDGAPGANKYGVIKAKNGMVISTKLESEGNMIKIQIPHDCPMPRTYTPHTCSRACAYPYEEDKYRKVSPLAIPFYLGWARLLGDQSDRNRDKIFYRTPCGLRLGSYKEIHNYIVRTRCDIPIDFFSTEPNIDCLNEFEPLRKIAYIKDLSYGKEWTPVTCVNSLDHEYPLYMDYKTARVPGKGVYISDDDGFLTCCDCEDDCEDKEKCACWQQTLSGISFKIAKEEGETLVGYENRRLKNHVLSGIYECNRKCKCRSTCFNRVVQHKVKWPIQLFKTVAKGWGVRAVHDMPQGSFICVYTGQLLTDQAANEAGIEAGDEYLAELDFIECNEQMKEDYESDVTDIENEEPGTRSKERRENQTKKKEETQIAKKSTGVSMVQKAVKSTGGIKRKYGDDDASSVASSGYSSIAGTASSRDVHVARKSGSKNGMKKQSKPSSGDSSSSKPSISRPPPSESSGVPTPPSSILSKRSSKDDSDSDDDDGNNVAAYSSFSASIGAKDLKNAPRRPLREYFGKDESVYIMDAKTMGNFGRYLNHSCNPNVFVQNLFVDTHDPRFPWVAFFTKKDVKAGTELTWDYNYEIGSVPTKTLYCYCLQPGCRGRLL